MSSAFKSREGLQFSLWTKQSLKTPTTGHFFSPGSVNTEIYYCKKLVSYVCVLNFAYTSHESVDIANKLMKFQRKHLVNWYSAFKNMKD